MPMKESNVIPVNCPIPPELLSMMEDYKIITNHLINSGLHHKIGLEKHYYPLAKTDTSGKPKPIPPDRELRDINKPWFIEHYKSKYAVHYLDSAASFAMQLIRSWRSLGGDITATPHIRKPIARLNNDLYTIQDSKPDGTMRIRITTAPHKSVVMDTKINHRRFSEWSLTRPGALVIVPSGLRLCFTDDTTVSKSTESAAYDFNFNRVVIARSDGQIKVVDLSDVMAIQKNHKAKRESVQKTMAHNPEKAERIIRKHGKREHNRVKDLLHKKIHGKNNEILSFVGSRHLGVEDLHGTTQDILKDDRGNVFNAKMSSWIHGQFEDIIVHHHPDSKLYYTRGTSRYCPFCSSKLTHPIWKQSKCPNCGLFDRDILEAVSGLIRTNTIHKKGEPWALVSDIFPQSIETKLLHSSTVMIRGLPSRQGVSKSVCPECAVLCLEGQSDIDNGKAVVMQENRNDADNLRVVGLEMTESGYDANSVIGERQVRLST
ncbi:MAG: hypothetical protein WAW23_11930 [Candidatus Methanoperedens sp.]